MNWTRAQLKSNAKLMVKKNWIMCVIVSLVMMLIAGNGGTGINLNYNIDPSNPNFSQQGLQNFASGVGGQWVYYVQRFMPVIAGTVAVISVLSLLAAIFIGNPLKVGGARFYLHNIHSQGILDDLAFAFRNMYGNVVMVMFTTDLFIALWSLLLVIPGVIKSYSWRMVPYLLADNPELDAREARELSAQMMDGEKMNAFVLDLSFILWDMLSAITMGIAGILWVNPYEDATNAELYMALQAKGREYYENV